MLDTTTQARPYARAIFEFAVAQNDMAAWSDTLCMLTEITTAPAVVSVLKNPSISGEQLSGLVIALGKSQLTDQAKNFVKLLAESNRLSTIPEIGELFERYRSEKEQTADVTVTSAIELDQAFQDKLSIQLNERLGTKTVLHCEVDEALLGGLLIQSGDTVIDATVQGELSRLKEALVE